MLTPESASTEVGERGGLAAAPLATVPSRLVRVRRYLSQDRVLAIIILSPSIIAVAVFIYGFMLWTGVVSFLNWNTPEAEIQWLGIDNRERIFGLRRFAKDIRNMSLLTVLFLVQCMGIGFLLAAFLGSAHQDGIAVPHDLCHALRHLGHRHRCRLEMADEPVIGHQPVV